MVWAHILFSPTLECTHNDTHIDHLCLLLSSYYQECTLGKVNVHSIKSEYKWNITCSSLAPSKIHLFWNAPLADVERCLGTGLWLHCHMGYPHTSFSNSCHCYSVRYLLCVVLPQPPSIPGEMNNDSACPLSSFHCRTLTYGFTDLLPRCEFRRHWFGW